MPSLTRRSVLLLAGALPLRPQTPPQDPRNIRTGRLIPDESYSDQPYVVVTPQGHWLCVLTTGKGVEGEGGQHVVSTISKDLGQTWSPLQDIEPAAGPEASWAMPLVVPYGRIYVFYTYNRDNIRTVRSNNPNTERRVDTLGAYAFRYSDDGGLNWSASRYYIPMRAMRIDRENEHNGEILFFWGVGKPILTRRYAIFGFAKVGRWGDPGTMVESQGCFLRSENILTERDPSKLQWTLLPDGDDGLRAPKGPVSDEANLVEMSDGTLYATYRTIDGYPCHAYSHDAGRSWTPPEYMTYTPGGRRIKHPRAANFVRRFSNGKYLYWFHNHGGDAAHTLEWTRSGYYRNRNPAWICGGVERSGRIHWSQPEILLYDEDPAVRISYPDFIEQEGRFFVTETQKEIARVHEIDRTLLESLWSQFDNQQPAGPGLAFRIEGAGSSIPIPRLDSLSSGAGFTIDFWVRLRELSPGQILFDSRDPSGRGVLLSTSARFTWNLTLNDGRQEFAWDSDPGTHPGTLRAGHWQHVAVIVDSGPKIVTFIVDGELNDGGAVRQFGWSRFPSTLGDINGAPLATIAPNLRGSLRVLRLYNRYLRTSEVIGNYRAGS